MKGVINIKIFSKEKTQSLNDFLNIKDIKDNYLYTLDGQVILFIKVFPINIELLSDDELEVKMDANSIEFSNEQYPYKIIVIPRAVDISEHIREQEELKKTLDDEVCIKIINNQEGMYIGVPAIINKNGVKEILELKLNEEDQAKFNHSCDIMKDNIENELNKRANTWIQRLKNCELKSEVLEERDIILLIKSFTIPEFARTEGTDYADNIVKIKRKGV